MIVVVWIRMNFFVRLRDVNGKVTKTFDNIWALGDCALTPNLKEIKRTQKQHAHQRHNLLCEWHLYWVKVFMPR